MKPKHQTATATVIGPKVVTGIVLLDWKTASAF